MIDINTWEELDRTIAIAAVLAEHRARLDEYRADYDLCDLARFVILTPGEAIDLPIEPEYVTEHKGFTETCLIFADDGFGWIVIALT